MPTTDPKVTTSVHVTKETGVVAYMLSNGQTMCIDLGRRFGAFAILGDPQDIADFAERLLLAVHGAMPAAPVEEVA